MSDDENIKTETETDVSTLLWVSPAAAAKTLGLTRELVMELIHEGIMPFVRRGSHYKVNVKLTNTYACRFAIKNAERVKTEILAKPFSRKKVANTRPNPGIRRVEV